MKQKLNQRQLTGIVSLFVAGLIIILSRFPAPEDPENTSQALLSEAYEQQLDTIQVEGQGVVSQILSDDLKGSRHQRFILRVSPEQTVLVAHNIDLAPRIENLKEGDTVNFFGVYQWNSQGGVIHWTHHDPVNRHPHGWLKHQGRVYQ